MGSKSFELPFFKGSFKRGDKMSFEKHIETLFWADLTIGGGESMSKRMNPDSWKMLKSYFQFTRHLSLSGIALNFTWNIQLLIEESTTTVQNTCTTCPFRRNMKNWSCPNNVIIWKEGRGLPTSERDPIIQYKYKLLDFYWRNHIFIWLIKIHSYC